MPHDRRDGLLQESSNTFPAQTLVLLLSGASVATIVRHRLPAVYSERDFVMRGGLVFSGADRVEIYRRAASYVDRILRGEKPGDFPISSRRGTNS